MSNEARKTFSIGSRFRIEASTGAGDIIVSPGPEGVVEARIDGDEGSFTMEQSGDLILIKPSRSGFLNRFSSADVFLTIPAGAELDLSCKSGDIAVNVPALDVDVSAASGDIRIEKIVRSGKVRSASGDVSIGDVGETCSVTTASGRIRIGAVGRDLTAASASGDLYVASVGEVADVKAASGDIKLQRFDGTDLAVKTLSGDVQIGLPPRRLLDVDLQTLSGELRNRLPEGDGSTPERSVVLRLTTVSGDVTLQGA